MRAHYDTVVVGGGFGGLGAALALAENGAEVLLCETLKYPGGCASTYERGGFRFESGATLFSGLGPEQLFGRWIEQYGLDVQVDWIDPLVDFRTPELRLSVPRDRGALVDLFAAMPGAPERGVRAFFAEQERTADVLWGVLARPELLPPLGLRSLLRHAVSLPRYLPLLRGMARPLERRMRAHGVAEFAPLRTFVDALAQITVQCPASEAEAPIAFGTLDYFYRGTGHVRGGIGELAFGLVSAIEQAGGEVALANAVRGIEPNGAGFRVRTRRGDVTADTVVANLLPSGLAKLLPPDAAALKRLETISAEVRGGWGACMLYLVAEAPNAAAPKPAHIQMVQDPSQPLREGNHLFASISGEADGDRAPAGCRTITVSTHVPMDSPPTAESVAAIQERMREGLRTLAPEWWQGVRHELTASPRTFERFTGRTDGFVGGIPRRAGLWNYRQALRGPIAKGLHLVGDSVFPGQSTLAAALGGVRAAARVAPGGV